jgi:hypothetical protein
LREHRRRVSPSPPFSLALPLPNLSNLVSQESVLVCGTNQRNEHGICETFNTPEYSTLDPNKWWWVGTVSIKGWAGANETGQYLKEYFCNVPKRQSGGDTVDCNTPWQPKSHR